jgi:hypothetical protein
VLYGEASTRARLCVRHSHTATYYTTILSERERGLQWTKLHWNVFVSRTLAHVAVPPLDLVLVRRNHVNGKSDEYVERGR